MSKSDPVTVAQEFHISVTPLGGDDYLVRIERVAPGVPLAEEQVRWSVDDWLLSARQLMNDPLLGVLQGNSSFGDDIFFLPEWDEPVSQSSLNLVALGQQLYNALFQGSLRDSWMMAQAIAQNQRSVLRLRLGLKGTTLPRLPWEVLHAGDRPLATGTDVAFSRYQLGPDFRHPAYASSKPHQPLKILMVIAGPSDQESLELAAEASHLQEELKARSPNEPPAIQLTILAQPGRERLTQALEQGQYQVFHYSGHSNLGDSGGDVYLVSDRTGLTETLNGDDLAGLLVNNGVQLAVFNSCRGAYIANQGDSNQDKNLAEALVKRGIPAVLAMAERIPDEVALTLTRLLYRNLNQGYPIDLSLSRARQGLIAAYGSNQLYWALPVLYLHPEFDGFLTSFADVAQNREQLFTLDDPLESPLPNADSLFGQPSRLTPTQFLTEQDDFEDDMDGSLADFEDDLEPNDSDADDTSAFIRDLLTQLDSKPVGGEVTPVVNNPAPPLPDFVNQELPPSSAVALPTHSPAPAQQQNIVNPHNRQAKTTPPFWRRVQAMPKQWLLLGATGAMAIALLGTWLLFNKPQTNPLVNLPVAQESLDGTNSPVNLKTTETSKLTADAIQQLSQGNLATGQKSVEELLNREALPQAKAALDVVPKSQIDKPEVSYLRGRLAWQFVKKDSRDFNISDARRYWETAHKAQPKNSAYLTALGFAYYGEDNFERANQAWFDALYLLEDTKGKTEAQAAPIKKTALTIYAGLAMGLRQSAQKQAAAKRASLLSESRKLRQKVLKDAPTDFSPEALNQNWLWTAKTIKDWRSTIGAK
ncbi:MAG: CHAT domain-containing protein [Coleofasciculaceae cyanobacterium]